MSDIDIKHVDGVSWADAPLPPRIHKCRAQTSGWVVLHYAERCACGAYRDRSKGPWVGRNSRRKDERPTPAPATPRKSLLRRLFRG